MVAGDVGEVDGLSVVETAVGFADAANGGAGDECETVAIPALGGVDGLASLADGADGAGGAAINICIIQLLFCPI